MPDIYSYYTTSTNVFIMKWIKHLGFHMIKEVVIKSNPDPGERKIAIKSPREIASAVVNK